MPSDSVRKKIVFISGALHHREPHQYRKTNMLLAQALNESRLPIDALVVPNDGYPEDSSIPVSIAQQVQKDETGNERARNELAQGPRARK